MQDSKVIISTCRYRKCREENIDIKEVIAMQISGYSSAAMLAYRSSGMKQKAGTVKMQDFSQMVQNTSAQATSKMTLGL